MVISPGESGKKTKAYLEEKKKAADMQIHCHYTDTGQLL